MKKLLPALILCLLLTGCMGNTGNSPWSHYGRSAEAAPSPLSYQTAQQSLGLPPYQQAQQGQMQQDQMQGQVWPAPEQQAQGYQQQQQAAGGPFPSSDDMQQPPPAGAVYAMPAAPPVKVALLVPMSGPQADLGQAMMQAAQMALFDIGYESFELMPRDSGDTPDQALQAAQSALSDGAQLILGPVFAPSVKAVKSIAAAQNVNVVAFSTDWTVAGDNTFVMGFMPFGQVQRVIEYAARNGIKRIAVLAPDNAYGDAVASAYSVAASRNGITTVDNLRFPENEGDLSDIVRRLAHYDQRIAHRASENDPVPPPPFDAVLLPVGGEKARAIAELFNYYEMGPSVVRRLGTGLWDDPSLASDKALAGAWFAAPDPGLRRDFEHRYVDNYGLQPPRLATLAYDATALAAVMARNGWQQTGQVSFDRAAIGNPNGFAGVDGVFRFRPDGLIERGLGVLEFRGGMIAVVDPAPATFQGWMGQ